MNPRIFAFSFLAALFALSLPAAGQESLGDVARQLRLQAAKPGPKAGKVYTNDNLPAANPGEGGVTSSGASSTPTVTPSDQARAEQDSHEAATNPARHPGRP